MARRPAWGRIAPAIAILLVAALTLVLVALGFSQRHNGLSTGSPAIGASVKPATAIPTVEPLILDASNPDEARHLNAEIPFSTAPNPAARPFHYAGDTVTLARATDCLAAAMLYEAGDDAAGERAVGQVVLNRLRHPAFPKTVCGVVFQGQERDTGCQFTFTCDGAMARRPNPAAWDRARGLARAMLAGDVYKPVGYSTHYHTDWVMPYWSKSLDKVVAVDTHLFFRWMGWWGTPAAFLRSLAVLAEPAIIKLAALSPAHKDDAVEFALDGAGPALTGDEFPPLTIGPEQIGRRIGPGKLTAVESGGNGFVMMLDKGGDPARYAEAAARICAGRAQCRLLAWTNPRETPQAFPVTEQSLNSMSFSYIRMKDTGLERTLFNCDEFPSAPRIQCMTRRIPIAPTPRLLADEHADRDQSGLPATARPAADAQAGLLQPDRIETIKLRARRDPPAPAVSQ
ncbi:MAG TPA: cell wall hydrolase [Sphingobium sp.]|nr:cell wall hydrolase [Sphingobium sp.]